MDTEPIVAELTKLKKRVYDAARYLLTILVILKEENIARMNVRTNRLSEKRLGFVHIAKNPLRLIHQCRVSVVLWNVERHDPKHLIGRCLKNFFANVFNVARSFGKSYQMLKNLVVNIVLVNVKLILRNLRFILQQIFTGLVNGIKQEKGFLNETIMLVRNVDLLAIVFMFTIKNLREMAELKKMKISLPFVCDAI